MGVITAVVVGHVLGARASRGGLEELDGAGTPARRLNSPGDMEPRAA